jgi:poly-gamma-glutamate synthesis protein (capsule biosynthesis protein)
MSEGHKVKLVAGGDIMFGEHPIMVGRGTASAILRNSAYDPLECVREHFAGADLALANLESVLSDPPAGSTPAERECRGPARSLSSLLDSGLDALNLANNHIQQHGAAPFHQTVSTLEQAGFGLVGRAGGGTGSAIPWDTEINNVPLRVLGYSLRPRQHFTGQPLYAEGPEERILEDVAAGRKRGRTVVVSLHWGDEFVPRPSRDQVGLGRRILDAGAVLVLGHHPHVLQGWESYRGGAIVYSLGNLVFDMPWLESLRRTALFSCSLGPEGVEDVAWIPLRIGDDFRPAPPNAATAKEIVDFLAEAKDNLERNQGAWSAPAPEVYRAMVGSHETEQRLASQKYFLRNMFRYEPGVLASQIGKFLRRRLGLLHD